jgi:hypothetical protein
MFFRSPLNFGDIKKHAIGQTNEQILCPLQRSHFMNLLKRQKYLDKDGCRTYRLEDGGSTDL